jgi:hypothetical protein
MLLEGEFSFPVELAESKRIHKRLKAVRSPLKFNRFISARSLAGPCGLEEAFPKERENIIYGFEEK